MLSLRSNQVVTLDQFVLLPMPDLVVQKITEEAHRQGYTRGEDPTLEFPDILEDEAYNGQLPEMMTIDGKDDVYQEIAHHENAVDDDEITPPAGVSATAQVQAIIASATEAALMALEPSTPPASSRELRELRELHRDAGFIEPSIATTPEEQSTRHGICWSRRLSVRTSSEVMLTREKINGNRAKITRHIVLQAGTDSLKDCAFKISGNTALREQGDEAKPMILAELKQMMKKHV
jgi:hypothetical protein